MEWCITVPYCLYIQSNYTNEREHCSILLAACICDQIKKKKERKKNYVWKSYKHMIRALHKSYVTIALNSTGALPVAK